MKELVSIVAQHIPDSITIKIVVDQICNALQIFGIFALMKAISDIPGTIKEIGRIASKIEK